jgi:hypothetical protein
VCCFLAAKSVALSVVDYGFGARCFLCPELGYGFGGGRGGGGLAACKVGALRNARSNPCLLDVKETTYERQDTNASAAMVKRITDSQFERLFRWGTMSMPPSLLDVQILSSSEDVDSVMSTIPALACERHTVCSKDVS